MGGGGAGSGKLVLKLAGSRIMKKYSVNTSVKPHNTIKRSLVRPKDKDEPKKMFEGMYSIFHVRTVMPHTSEKRNVA